MIQELYLTGTRHRQVIFLAIIAITAFFIVGLPRLTVDTNLDSLIAANDPDRLVYQRVLEEFGTDNKVFILVEDANLWSPEKLSTLERLHHELESINDISEVDSLFSLRTLQRVDGKLESGLVIDHPLHSQSDAKNLHDSLFNNQMLVGDYFSADDRVTELVLSLGNDRSAVSDNERIYNEIDAVIGKYQGSFDALSQIGTPRLYAELKNQLISDFRLLGPLSAIIAFICILFFVRSLLAATIPIITSAVVITWTFGLQGWAGIPITILSTMLPPLIIIVASTTPMHIVIAYIRRMRSNPKATHEGIMRMIAKHTGLSFLLSSLIISLGFASNLFNNIGLIRNFAIVSTFAILSLGVVTVLFVPGLLAIYLKTTEKFVGKKNPSDQYPDKLLASLEKVHGRFPGAILIVTVLLSIFFFFHASTFHVTNDPVLYFSANQSLMQDNERLHEELAGANIFFIALESNSEKAFLEPRNIEKLARIQDFVREQGVFDQSRSLADFLKFVHKEIQGEQPGLPLPRTRQLIAQYLLQFHRSELKSYVSQDYSRANIVVRHNIHDSQLLNKYISELEDVVEQVAGAELASSVVGKNLMVNQAAESLKQAQVKAFGLLVLLVFIIVSALFTSPKGGLIALIPALVPVAIMYGMMGLLNIPLNPGTAMVAVICVALSVDGCLHLLTSYIDHCRHTSDYPGAVTASVKEVAPPLLISCLALSLGFGILMLSRFTVVAQSGALITATVLLSVCATLMITPILMSRIRLVGLYQILALSLDEDSLAHCSLFRNMTDYQRRKAILISELDEFKAGELLIEQDTPGRSMYLILSGEAEVIRHDHGTSHVLASLEPGQIFGEIGYIMETRRTTDVRAKSDITTLKFDYQRLQKDLKYFPNIVAKLNFNISCILGERLADMVEQKRI